MVEINILFCICFVLFIITLCVSVVIIVRHLSNRLNKLHKEIEELGTNFVSLDLKREKDKEELLKKIFYSYSNNSSIIPKHEHRISSTDFK